MRIPLVDLHAQYLVHRGAIDAAIQTVLDDCLFYKGPHVEAFESQFAATVKAEHCIGVANCTDAPYLCLRALGIGTGDEVIVPANTFIATAEAVTLAGARPVFVDIDPATYNIDIKKIGGAVTWVTKAIIPVHLCGRAVDMEHLRSVASVHSLKIIEDCAQAVGAEWGGRPVGTWGDAGCFSFYPSKNLGAYGDGGAVITDDGALARKVRMLADHGRERKFDHEFEGMSSRLDALQAAILTAKLPHLGFWNYRRYLGALTYEVNLQHQADIMLPDIPANRKNHVFHCYVVRLKDRDGVRARLAEKGIETGLHYPVALPFAKAYSRFGHQPEDFPEAFAFTQECLSLPLYPELTGDKIAFVADSLIEAMNANS